jgi:hypothetical protein
MVIKNQNQYRNISNPISLSLSDLEVSWWPMVWLASLWGGREARGVDQPQFFHYLAMFHSYLAIFAHFACFLNLHSNITNKSYGTQLVTRLVTLFMKYLSIIDGQKHRITIVNTPMLRLCSSLSKAKANVWDQELLRYVF